MYNILINIRYILFGFNGILRIWRWNFNQKLDMKNIWYIFISDFTKHILWLTKIIKISNIV